MSGDIQIGPAGARCLPRWLCKCEIFREFRYLGLMSTSHRAPAQPCRPLGRSPRMPTASPKRASLRQWPAVILMFPSRAPVRSRQLPSTFLAASGCGSHQLDFDRIHRQHHVRSEPSGAIRGHAVSTWITDASDGRWSALHQSRIRGGIDHRRRHRHVRQGVFFWRRGLWQPRAVAQLPAATRAIQWCADATSGVWI